jgi:hypothetical protein
MDESDFISIKVLCVDKKLEWLLTETDLKIKSSQEKPCDHAK